jgi:hypothetical protein
MQRSVAALEKSATLSHADKAPASKGARGSFGRTELGSVPLHRHTSSHWRAADCSNHIQGGNIHITQRHFPPA